MSELSNIDKRYFKMAIGNVKSETSNDICARCPICGDSKYSKSKARLHLYHRNGLTLVNCFNECSVQNMTVSNFLRTYYPTIYELYKKENFENRLNELKVSQRLRDNAFNKSALGDISKTLNLSFDNVPSIPKPNKLFDLSPYLKEPSQDIINYVKSRGIDPNSFKFFTIDTNITIDNKNYPIKDFLIIPLYCDGKMYGFYSRSITEKRFYTYIPQENQGFKVWNYYNIDRSKTVYFCEGIFDALSLKASGLANVVACLGATPPNELLKDLDCVMVFDNDKCGKNNAIAYAPKHKVVVYPTLPYKDTNEMLLNGVDVKELVLNNTNEGILAIVKIKATL